MFNIRINKDKYFADREFYKKVFMLVIPMVLQAAITNFVSLLDNIMVGQIGTVQMSGVSIVNQYIFIFNLTMFGAVSGPGIFGTQFFGKGDHEGQRYTVRFRIMTAVIISAAAVFIFLAFKEPLIGIFLSGGDDPVLVSETLAYGIEYTRVIVFSLFPFAISQVYASVIRESGITSIPMLASVLAFFANLFLDYSLIFGKFGMPMLGVTGAALATIAAKCIEAAVIIIWAHTHKEKNRWAEGLYKSVYIPGELFKRILIKSLPLLFNEFLWSLSVSVVAQCYSLRGLDVVAARNIASTLNNMFNVVYVQIGAGIGIILGQLLGMKKFEEAKRRSTHLMVFTVIIGAIIALGMLPLAFFFPMTYNTEAQIQSLACFFILIQAAATPVFSYANGCYFILRSGGKTGLTFLFDFGFSWFLMIPLAFILSYCTDISIYWLFTIVTFSEIIKIIIGYFFIKSEKWVNNIIE